MSRKLLSICLFSCFLCTILLGARVWGDLEKKPLVPEKLFLKGTPYELGYQHGQRLKEAVAYNVKRIIDGKILANPEHPQVKSFLAMLPKVLEHVPQDYIQELKGLAAGAEVPYEKILLFNLFPEMFHCTGITVKGQAVRRKELYHVRVLDYAVGADLQDTAVLMIVQPEGKIPFLNVSYAGFIGSITGMNDQNIAIGEIGGKGYGQYDGMPMAFLLRQILEKATSLQAVKEILAAVPRTCEYYYIFSDGKTKESIGVYATGQQLQFIEPGTTYALFDSVFPQNPSLNPENKIVLQPAQIDISSYQTLFYKDQNKQQLWGLVHRQPKECLILTGFCHTQRYPILVDRILVRYGYITENELQEIIQGEAGRPTNVHTAIFAPASLDAWIAHAGEKGEPAWSQPYRHYNLKTLLEEANKERLKSVP